MATAEVSSSPHLRARWHQWSARRRNDRWGCALLGVVLGGLVFLAAHSALVDDAYITLDYARSLAFHGSWALEPGHLSNTATSPLNVLLLAVVSTVIRAPVVAVGILLVASLGVLGAALSATCSHLGIRQWSALVALGVVATSPILVSTVGLETYLAVTLIACLGWATLTGRAAPAGAVGGLLVLTRPDLVAFLLVALVTPALRRRAPVTLGAAAVVVLPWFAISWWWLGSALPDTMLLKIGGQWGPHTFVNGLLLYEGRYPVATWLSVLPAFVGLAAMLCRAAQELRRRTAAGATLEWVWVGGAGLHLITFAALHTAPYHWYYGPALGSLTLGVTCLGRFGRLPVVAGLGAGVVLLVVTGTFLVQRSWLTAPIMTNWATAAQYAAAAGEAPPGAVLRSPGEIGTLAYFCDCTVVDSFSDRALIAQLLARREAGEAALMRRLLKLNYARLEPGTPLEPGYAFVFDPRGQGVHTGTPWKGPNVLIVRPLGR